MRFTSLASFTPDLHEFHSVSGYGVNLQDISNAWGVEFVFEEVGFQGRGFLRFQAAVERPSRYPDRLGETKCFHEILGIAQREFLTVKVADERGSLVSAHRGQVIVGVLGFVCLGCCRSVPSARLF
jgi:hypothetical protein